MKAAYTNPTATPSGRSGLEAALGVCRAAGLVAVGAASLPQPLPAPVLGQLPGCMTIKKKPVPFQTYSPNINHLLSKLKKKEKKKP